MKSANFPVQYHRIIEVIKPSGAYLVGGAVRDLLLGKKIHDLDFALPKDTINYAKKLADQLEGDFYLMDKERQTARVILKDQDQKRLLVDFTVFQGTSIDQDLHSRDFTITSMAMDINQDLKLIDLFQGAQDLSDGVIRATTDHSLRDDPLRCIRAVRMAAQLGFRILPETKQQIHASKELLAEISAERIRDEIFRILEGPQQAAALKSLQILGIYSRVFSTELADWQGPILRKITEFWRMMIVNHDQDSASNWTYGLFIHRLGRFREQIKAHLQAEPVIGRSVYQLSFLLPLLLPSGDLSQISGEYQTWDYTVVNSLSLSNQENERLEKGTQAAFHFYQLASKKVKLLPIEVYKFFRDFNNAGVEGIIIALACYLIQQEGVLQKTGWQDQLDTARYLLEGWWEKRTEWIYPPVLLNGDDLQNELCMNPGPEIGKMLEALREAQVRYRFDTRQAALEYLKNIKD